MIASPQHRRMRDALTHGIGPDYPFATYELGGVIIPNPFREPPGPRDGFGVKLSDVEVSALARLFDRIKGIAPDEDRQWQAVVQALEERLKLHSPSSTLTRSDGAGSVIGLLHAISAEGFDSVAEDGAGGLVLRRGVRRFAIRPDQRAGAIRCLKLTSTAGFGPVRPSLWGRLRMAMHRTKLAFEPELPF